MKLLLHACCGPCSLEPARLLQAAGHTLSLAYMNANIHPAAEYAQRLATLRTWAASQNLALVEGAYDVATWEARVGCFGAEPATRQQRCAACYRLRLEEAARYAADHGFEGIATTLSVSPYQYTSAIEQELRRAARGVGIAAVFEDFRPFYPQATRASKQLGMYRQNYCGCRFSAAEAAQERAQRAEERRAIKQAQHDANAGQRARAAAQLAAKKAEKQAYAAKQEAKHALKEKLRAEARGGSSPGGDLASSPARNPDQHEGKTPHENQ
ncbi:MAG: epoxyqueuosine reductase QueH [Raoultibacter sp.]